jgi:hypothetical protein
VACDGVQACGMKLNIFAGFNCEAEIAIWHAPKVNHASLGRRCFFKFYANTFLETNA